MPNKLTAAIVALVIGSASAIPAHATPPPTVRNPEHFAARLDAYGMAMDGLHRLGVFLLGVKAQHDRDVWTFTARANEAETARRAGTSTSSTAAPSSAPSTSGRCGGDLPPCYVMMRESGGNIHARNPSGAGGKWQIMPYVWNGFGGYANAADAPEWVQDAKARTMALCNWQPPNYCS